MAPHKWTGPAQARSFCCCLLLLAAAASVPRAAARVWHFVDPEVVEAANLPSCPPEGFAALPGLNLTAYTQAPWYVQKQLPVSYQGEGDPRDYLYCVRQTFVPVPADAGSATGDRVGRFGPFGAPRDIPLLRVLNYANRGQVNGPPVGAVAQNATSGGGGGALLLPAPLYPQDLVAVPDPGARGTPAENSSLLLGPSLYVTPLLTFGWRPLGLEPYWVVAAQRSNDTSLGYDWAVVTAGAPRFPTPTGCSSDPSVPVYVSSQPPQRGDLGDLFNWITDTVQAKVRHVHDSLTRGSSSPGLWLLARRPQDPAAAAAAEAAASALGLDVSGLVAVQQEGCSYEGVQGGGAGAGGGGAAGAAGTSRAAPSNASAAGSNATAVQLTPVEAAGAAAAPPAARNATEAQPPPATAAGAQPVAPSSAAAQPPTAAAPPTVVVSLLPPPSRAETPPSAPPPAAATPPPPATLPPPTTLPPPAPRPPPATPRQPSVSASAKPPLAPPAAAPAPPSAPRSTDPTASNGGGGAVSGEQAGGGGGGDGDTQAVQLGRLPPSAVLLSDRGGDP